MRKSVLLVSVLALIFATAASAGNYIDFTNDTPSGKPNGWQSVDSNQVSFFDSFGQDLEVADYGNQSHGQGLAVYWDSDPSFLIMQFATPCTILQLAFGNDEPGWITPGDYAELRIFSNNVQVGLSRVIMNRDDIMNQSIGIGGITFDKAEFEYVVIHPFDGGPGLIEVVDDIGFCPVVPEPSSFMALGLGLAGLLFRRRR